MSVSVGFYKLQKRSCSSSVTVQGLMQQALIVGAQDLLNLQVLSAKQCDHALAGAGQGIGRAVAHGLGEAGASVAVVDIAGQKAESTSAELRAKGIRSIAIQADVRSKKACEE